MAVQNNDNDGYADDINIFIDEMLISDSEFHIQMNKILQHFKCGITHLRSFAEILGSSHLDPEHLSSSSRYARQEINLAKRAMDNYIKKLEIETADILNKKRIQEEAIGNLKAKMQSLSTSIIRRKDELIKYEEEVSETSRQVQKLEEKAESTKKTTLFVRAFAAVALIGTGIVAGVVIVASAGLAAPAVGILTAEAGVSVIVQKVTADNIKDAKDALSNKQNVLCELEKDLYIFEHMLNTILQEQNSTEKELEDIELKNHKLTKELVISTKIRSLICPCHSDIDIALGRVEVLTDKQKRTVFQNQLKITMCDVIAHLSTMFTNKEFELSPFKQLLNSITNELRPLENLQIQWQNRIDCQDNESDSEQNNKDLEEDNQDEKTHKSCLKTTFCCLFPRIKSYCRRIRDNFCCCCPDIETCCRCLKKIIYCCFELISVLTELRN